MSLAVAGGNSVLSKARVISRGWKHLRASSLRPVQLQRCLARNMSSKSYTFETLAVTQPREYVYQVELNRPKTLNAMNMAFWSEVRTCFNELAEDKECRVVILSGAGRAFTSGLDLKEVFQRVMDIDGTDVGRRGMAILRFVLPMQESFTVIEKCPKPVIAAVHSHCVGAGIDMLSACDIRLCTQDAHFVIKETDIGTAADVGTLQRFPGVVGNDSTARELIYTCRPFQGDKAKEIGFVSRVYPDKESLISGALELATTISKKSPIAVQGSKVNLIYSRDHSVPDSLHYQATWNSMMLQSEDLPKAAMAAMNKETPEFSNM